MTILEVTSKIETKMLNIIRKSCLTAFVILFIILSYIISVRYMNFIPVVWMDDIVNLLMVWIVFIGAILPMKNNSHISVEYFGEYLKKEIYIYGKRYKL